MPWREVDEDLTRHGADLRAEPTQFVNRLHEEMRPGDDRPILSDANASSPDPRAGHRLEDLWGSASQ